MFFRRHKPGRRHTNILFITFRLILSMMMLAVLVGGVYSAYKHFSGLDPLKLDPQAIVSNLLSAKTPRQFLAALSSIKLSEKVVGQSKKVIPADTQTGSQIPLENLTKPVSKTSKPAFNFLLVADSHSDNINLTKALTQAKNKDPKFIIGLGDYTDVGTIGELKGAKKEFDLSGLRYFLVVGDHDLWDSRNRSLPANSNFREVFGPSYQSFIYDNFLFILLYNSDNYMGIDQQQLDWLLSELQKAKQAGVKAIYVFTHEPFYHPSSDHVMGRVEPKLKQQAKTLIQTLKDFAVKEVFAGDIHFFSQYVEPESNLNMMTVGAITSERNAQAPRFALATVFEDGTVEIEDVEIK